MVPPRRQSQFIRGNATLRSRMNRHRDARIQLRYELLEPRHLLASDLDLAGVQPSAAYEQPISAESPKGYTPTKAPITWFEHFDNVSRVALESLATVDRPLAAGVAGPQELAIGEWIVQLNGDATADVRRVASVNELLNDSTNQFTVISGLGTPGLVLVRAQGLSRAEIEARLTANDAVKSFSLNQLIQGQQTPPNESDFRTGLLIGLDIIDAKNAWDVSIGSMNTVVGVVDTGIDPTHPDLYLNIWINQGELPPEFLDNVGDKLVDLDGDGLITFYDLNNLKRLPDGRIVVASTGVFAMQDELTDATPFMDGLNATLVQFTDQRGNRNGRIDAADLLADPNWADGRDTDNNGFFDDFFGVNFRAGADDPLPSNDPSDPLGHGTHVAGTIGAIGNNGTGVVGVNWQTSLMSLRILDNNNQGDSGAAIRAVNYAREMRERLTINTANRVTEGANVKVLNNSWGQPGGFESSLEAAIADSGEAGIMFVAAAGNGNILGNGVDNDRTPFFPASYSVPNVIAVAASDAVDNRASFSNFGKTSVDLFAPGVGIRSTLPGGAIGGANGTSMATPHVAGTAALIWSAFPEATVGEVRKAILDAENIDRITNGSSLVTTAGRLNASKAINADVFAPAARLISKQDIRVSGGTSTDFIVEYSHRSGIDTSTLGNDDLIVTRQWGPAEPIIATLKANSVITTATTATATYVLAAPGESWDALDFGDYVISTVAGKVQSLVGNKTTEVRDIGLFNVRINDPSVLYVSSFADSLDAGALRSQIIAANAAAPLARTIILDTGKYTIDIPLVVDPSSSFGASLAAFDIVNTGGWSNAATGDFDIQGNVTIVGDTNDETVIDAQGLDRVFKVHQDASLGISRLTIQGGVSPETQGGGGILSLGNLTVNQAIARKNTALGPTASNPIFGGAIAAWNGHAIVNESWITENRSDFGGGIYLGGTAAGEVQRSTVDTNLGGGLYSLSSNDVDVSNSTFSANSGGYGAIANGIRNGFLNGNASSNIPSLSADGRFIVFTSDASNLVLGDNNGQVSSFDGTDVFVYDSVTSEIKRVSVNDDGVEGNDSSSSPSISGDGRYIAFESLASNLVPGDSNGDSDPIFFSATDIFVYDTTTQRIQRVSVSSAGEEANAPSTTPTLNADGRYVAFVSSASNLVPNDNNGHIDSSSGRDIFVYDMVTKQVQRVSVSDSGEEGNDFSLSPSLSADGRYVTFESDATNLVLGDNNNTRDIFFYDTVMKKIQRVSVSDENAEGNGFSSSASQSANGRYIAFESTASNLVSGDNNDLVDIFVYDTVLQQIQRVSVSDAGVEGNGDSRSPSLSADGRYVTFASNASNLVPGDNSERTDIFVYDTVTKQIQRVSVSNAGVEGNEDSYSPSLNADGRYVSFASFASNLVPGDNNDRSDIFLYDTVTKNIQPITYQASASIVNVSQTTVAFTRKPLVNASVFGDVQVNDSLFVASEASSDFFSRLESPSLRNVFSVTPGASLVTPLQRSGTRPPVHQLTLGNPAIDSATPVLNGTTDQLGKTRVAADVGAVEAITAKIAGKVYVDINRDGRMNPNEPGIPGAVVKITSTGVNENIITSRSNDLRTSQTDESGVLELAELNRGSYQFVLQPAPGWSVSLPQAELLRNGSILGNGDSGVPSLSADGRYVAFESDASNLVTEDNNDERDIFFYDSVTKQVRRVSVSNLGVEGNNFNFPPSLSANGRFVALESLASNLVSGDNNELIDVFVFDTLTSRIQRVSVSDAGVEGNGGSRSPSLSIDGRYVTFESDASNLVLGDNNNTRDIFVYDTVTNQVQRVSISNAGVEGNNRSDSPSLSSDGRYVAFDSRASNLVPNDNNGLTSISGTDVFVYDTVTKQIQRVSVSDAGVEGNDSSSSPSLSADGRYVAFNSSASNLVPSDNNGRVDIFVYDTVTKQIQRVSVNNSGVEGNDHSRLPSLSADGRYVTFESDASNLVSGDNNERTDIFVYDTVTKQIQRVSVSDAGVGGIGGSEDPSLSADGRFIAFSTEASNLVPGDINDRSDIIIARNPLFPPGVLTAQLRAGEVFTDLNFGLVPDPGTISGRVFEDDIGNGVFDDGEPPAANALVFLDLDGDRILDDGEVSVTTDAEGIYRFLSTDSFQSYSVVVRLPIGFEQITPGVDQQFAWNIFLPVGGAVTERDFAIRRVTSVAQSDASAVSGRVYEERDGVPGFTAGDAPLVNKEVYLDVANFGTRDPNETRELTDENGVYSIGRLGSRNVSVTVDLDESLVHQKPLGNSFAPSSSPLFQGLQPFGKVEAIAVGDFNADTFEDVALAYAEGSRIGIRLNDKQGGFSPVELDFDLGKDASGPSSLVVGNFDANPLLDVAFTANASGNVIVLLNFDPTLGESKFRATQVIPVGQEPIDLVSGQFNDDALLDLIVVNKGNASVANDETVQVLLNTNGVFVAGPAIPTGGLEPVSIVAGNFTGDSALDIAVVHAAPNLAVAPGTASGGVTVLRGDNNGGLNQQQDAYYIVGGSPFDAVTADFNRDGLTDIAVANSATNTVSILLGQNGGTLRVQSNTLGTATGAFDIAVGDLDRDGDADVIVSNVRDQNVSVFRNNGVDPYAQGSFESKDVQFAPLQNFGLGEGSRGQRMPLVVADFDKVLSGPNRQGTLDIVTAQRTKQVLNSLTNVLIDGSHRVALTGSNAISDLDFVITPAILPPSFSFETLPQPIVEDAPEQKIAILDIKKGRENSRALDFSVTISNTALIASATVTIIDGTARAIVAYTPLKDANGTTVLTVRATDAGADATFDSADDGIFERSFTVTVLAVDDPDPIIKLNNANEIVNMTGTPNNFLANINFIDIRGTGNNSLVLDAGKIRSVTPNQTLRVLADAGDQITFGEGWSFSGVESVDGQLQRTFENDGATVHVVGPRDWTNPFIAGDVNGSGDVTAGDALDIIFSLGQPQFFDSQGRLVDATTVAPETFRFYDPNEDGMSTAADALFVINVLFLQSLGGSGESESNAEQSALLERREVDGEDTIDVVLDSTLDLRSSDKARRLVLSSSATESVATVTTEPPNESQQDQDERLGDLDATLTTVWDWI